MHLTPPAPAISLDIAWLYDLNACRQPTGVTRHALAQADALGQRADVRFQALSGKFKCQEGLDFWNRLSPNKRSLLPFSTRHMHRIWRLAGFPAPDFWTGSVDWVYCPTEFYVPTRKARLAITSHDVKQDLAFQNPRRRAFLARAFRRADLVLSVSHFNTSELLNAFPFTAGKIAHVPNAAEDLFFQPASSRERAEIRANLGIPTGIPFLLSVANFQPRKNLEGLLRAAGRINAIARGEIAIVLIGTGAPQEHARLQAAIAELPPKAIVALPGYREGAQLRAAYAEATALAFPSFCESFGIPAAEAMAQGCPVALANSTALPEIAADAGWYFDPRNLDDITSTLQTLIDHPAEAKRRAHIGKARAEHFRWEYSCDLLVDALRHPTP